MELDNTLLFGLDYILIFRKRQIKAQIHEEGNEPWTSHVVEHLKFESLSVCCL